jgi:hypothetical protein
MIQRKNGLTAPVAAKTIHANGGKVNYHSSFVTVGSKFMLCHKAANRETMLPGLCPEKARLATALA